jgi:hypothetical protein
MIAKVGHARPSFYAHSRKGCKIWNNRFPIAHHPRITPYFHIVAAAVSLLCCLEAGIVKSHAKKTFQRTIGGQP